MTVSITYLLVIRSTVLPSFLCLSCHSERCIHIVELPGPIDLSWLDVPAWILDGHIWLMGTSCIELVMGNLNR